MASPLVLPAVLVAEIGGSRAEAQTVVTGGSSQGNYDHDQKAAVLAIADKLDGMSL